MTNLEEKKTKLIACSHNSNNMQITMFDPNKELISEEELDVLSKELFELN